MATENFGLKRGEIELIYAGSEKMKKILILLFSPILVPILMLLSIYFLTKITKNLILPIGLTISFIFAFRTIFEMVRK